MQENIWILCIAVAAVTRVAASESCIDVNRSSWGAKRGYPGMPLYTPVKHVFIAHTVTPFCEDFITCSDMMRRMQNYHMGNHGWPDIGYNFVIGGDGRVYEGVGFRTEGIHTRGFNDKSIAIAFIGNFMTRVPSTEMLDAAKKLIICGIKNGYISHDRELHGHRDGTCTKSPGDLLYVIIQRWPRFKGGPLPGYTC